MIRGAFNCPSCCPSKVPRPTGGSPKEIAAMLPIKYELAFHESDFSGGSSACCQPLVMKHQLNRKWCSAFHEFETKGTGRSRAVVARKEDFKRSSGEDLAALVLAEFKRLKEGARSLQTLVSYPTVGVNHEQLGM